jgi:fumarate reductase iron-sulfur subunit
VNLIATQESSRTLRLTVMRHNPAEPGIAPYLQTFEIEEAPGMTLFIALNEIREQQDPSLQFDFVCRAGVCGSCAMVINGKPRLACRTLTRDLPDHVQLAPLPGFELVGDLSVNTGKWMRQVTERMQTWIHQKEGEARVDLDALEQRMEPELAERIYELERCIECGCCVAACGAAQMRPEFIGAAGLVQLARFRLDPRDKRDNADYYQVVGDETGVFGCMTLLGCEDVCPKDLPLAQQIAYLRRQMALTK